MNRVSYINLFARDIEALCRFYAGTFGFEEIESVRSPIFRAVEAGGCRIGFNAHAAYGLLNLDGHAATSGAKAMVTVAVDGPAEADRLVPLAVANGATLVKPLFRTAYGTYQAVLFDPEGHVLRIDAPLS